MNTILSKLFRMAGAYLLKMAINFAEKENGVKETKNETPVKRGRGRPRKNPL